MKSLHLLKISVTCSSLQLSYIIIDMLNTNYKLLSGVRFIVSYIPVPLQ